MSVWDLFTLGPLMTSLVCEFPFLLNLPLANLEWPAIFFVLPCPPSTGTSFEFHSGFSWSCEPISLLDKMRFAGDKGLFVCFGSWTCLKAGQPKHHGFFLLRGRLFSAGSSSWKWFTLSHGASSSAFPSQNDFSVLGILRLFWWLIVWGLCHLLNLCISNYLAIGHCCETHHLSAPEASCQNLGRHWNPTDNISSCSGTIVKRLYLLFYPFLAPAFD